MDLEIVTLAARPELMDGFWDMETSWPEFMKHDPIGNGYYASLGEFADFVLVCPATADLLAKMANGIADDLATTLLLATDKPVVVAPAMNVRMWLHAATRRNVQQLVEDGIKVIEPAEGDMACGEHGPGRLPEPQAIVEWLVHNQLLPRSSAAGEGDHAQHGGGG